MDGFRKFILRGNVVDLAVGIVIGAGFAAVVTAFVEDLVTPLIGVFGGVPDFSALTFELNGSTFKVGHFINAALAFLLIAAIVYYLVVLPVNRLMDRFKPEEPPATRTRECPECLSKIPLAARRCAFCGSAVEPVARAAAGGEAPAAVPRG
jgi:large conductance mechanosensitive channel